jgi:hypothetical protein
MPVINVNCHLHDRKHGMRLAWRDEKLDEQQSFAKY